MNSNLDLYLDILEKVDFENHLCQGDIILKDDIIQDFFTEEQAIGLMILSYTCHIVNRTVTNILVSPIFEMEFYIRHYVIAYFKKKEQEGKKASKEGAYKSLEKRIILLSNYDDKEFFFFPPDDIFKNSAVISQLTRISYGLLDVVESDFLKSRVASLKNPWREKLGYMTGNLFNRVATFTPNKKKVKEWVKNEYTQLIYSFADSYL